MLDDPSERFRAAAEFDCNPAAPEPDWDTPATLWDPLPNEPFNPDSAEPTPVLVIDASWRITKIPPVIDADCVVTFADTAPIPVALPLRTSEVPFAVFDDNPEFTTAPEPGAPPWVTPAVLSDTFPVPLFAPLVAVPVPVFDVPEVVSTTAKPPPPLTACDV